MALIAEFTTIKPELAHTKTYEDFYKFIGAKPHRMGIVSTMYKHMTSSYLTEGLGNIIYNKKQSGNKFQKINSLMFDWEIDVKFIKRIKFAAVPSGNGTNGAEITMYFAEKYYERNDTFVIELSKQQCFVMASPIRKADNFWEYSVKLIDSNYNSVLDTTACQIGMETRFITNYQPELHEEGFAKFQSNVERHRNWITEHRVDVDYSSRWKAHEEAFVKIANGEGGGDYREAIFKMPKIKQQLLDSFMEARNNSMLLAKGTMDANGKSTIQDRQGRDIIAGDGAIPQINRFAGMYNYAKMSVAVFNKAITTLSQKSEQPTGNTYLFICNEKAYADVQTALAEYLNQFKMISPVVYSVKEGKEVEVGVEYTGYNFLGNKVIFKVDRALSYEYPNKGYSVLIDLTADKATGAPSIQMFTLAGQEFKSHVLNGVGGDTEVISSPVAGTKMVISGYSGIGVFSPYRAYVLMSN